MLVSAFRRAYVRCRFVVNWEEMPPCEKWKPDGDASQRLRGMLLQADGLCLGAVSPSVTPKSAAALIDESQTRWGGGTPPTSCRRRRRYLAELKGGDVPRCAPSDPHALELLRRGLPVVLTGGAIFGRDTAVGRWTATTLIQRLAGTEQAALVAPPAAARRFAFYNRKNHVGGKESPRRLHAHFLSGRTESRCAQGTMATASSVQWTRRRALRSRPAC